MPEGDCIHGIHASAPVRIENVTVQNFAHDGIHIVGAECGKPIFEKDGKPVVDCDPALDPECKPMIGVDGRPVQVYDGNADGSYVENCTVGSCGRDGFHFRGGDAQACVISCCSGVLNGRAGFYDETFGNTYLGCHSAYNIGPNYITELLVNASVFINCWSEEGGPSKNEFHGQVTIISGKIGGNPQYMTPGSSAFILEHGVATRAPLVYKNLGLLDDGTRATSIGCSLGSMSQTYQSPDLNMVAFQWATLKSAEEQDPEDTTSLRYLDKPYIQPSDRGYRWWALEHNNSLYRHMIRFPTADAFARLPAPWFVNGIYLGRDDIGPPKVSFTAAPTLPNTQDSGDPLTYEKGDVVWNSEPSPGGPIGQVCIDSGTQSFSFGFQTDDPVNVGDTTVKLNKVDGLVPGQYITIGGGADVHTIIRVTLANSTIDITPGTLIGVSVGADIAIAGGMPVGVQTSKIVNKGDTTVMLNKADGLMSGQNVTFTGFPDIYTIVKVTLPAIEIAPGVLAAVPVGKAIAFSPAAFSTFGEVIGKSAAYDASNPLPPLALADRYVTVTATGTLTLPPSPADGQTHSIKSGAGVTTTVTTADALKIDGVSTTATIGPSQNVTFRYTATTSEWEIR